MRPTPVPSPSGRVVETDEQEIQTPRALCPRENRHIPPAPGRRCRSQTPLKTSNAFQIPLPVLTLALVSTIAVLAILPLPLPTVVYSGGASTTTLSSVSKLRLWNRCCVTCCMRTCCSRGRTSGVVFSGIGTFRAKETRFGFSEARGGLWTLVRGETVGSKEGRWVIEVGGEGGKVVRS